MELGEGDFSKFQPEIAYERCAEIVKTLFKGQPVRCPAVAKIIGSSSKNTASLLSRAKHRGLVKPCGRRGWIPADATDLMGESPYLWQRAAATVAELYDGIPVRCCAVSQQLDTRVPIVFAALKAAARRRLVKKVGARWKPVSI